MRKETFRQYRWVGTSAVLGLIVALSIARCGTSSSSVADYRQEERLARPGINEALILTPAYLAAFNQIAPSLDLSSTATPVLTEAAQVLTALYGAACLLGLQPPVVDCPANGNAVFGADNKLTSAMVTAATQYANTVAAQFLPDVMRIDTSVPSGYLTLCGGSSGPLLCGGRLLTDDVIDVTYTYLLNGKTLGAVSDGVSYAGNNAQQGHKAVLAAFPFAPAPY